jgi:DNA-binding MarR family transcriptional regulator
MKTRNSKNKGQRFGIVPIEVAEAGLTCSALGTYIMLAAHGFNNSQKAWPSVSTMACHLGVSDKSVERGLTELISHGLIEKAGIHEDAGTVIYRLLDTGHLVRKDCQKRKRGRPIVT